MAESSAADSERQPRLRPWQLDAAAVGLIAVLFLIAQKLLFPGPEVGDPVYYLKEGMRWPHVRANYWNLRIGLMVVVRGFEFLFGPSAVVLFGIPAIAAVLLAGSCYGIMRVLFQDRVVAIAGALVVVLNQDALLNSAFLFPDPVSTAIFALGFLLLLLAGRETRLTGQWPTIVAVLAGVLLGYTYLVREFSPLLGPGVIIALVLLRYPLRRAALAVAGAASMFVVELIYGEVAYGDPFERLKILISRKPTSAHRLAQWAPFRNDIHNIFQALLVFPHLLLSFNAGWVMIALLIVFAVAFAVRRDRVFGLLVAWFASLWLLLAIVAIARHSNHNPAIEVGNIRYWYAGLPPLAMGGIAGVFVLVRGHATVGKRVVAAQLSAVVVAAIVIVPGAIEFAHCTTKGIGYAQSDAAWTAAGNYLAGPAGHSYQVIEGDSDSAELLSVYTRSFFGARRWHGSFKFLPNTNDVPVPSTSASSTLLLVNADRTHKPEAEGLLNHWRPVWASSDGVLALLTPKQDSPSADPAATLALKQRWLAAYGIRPFTPGRCGDSPYATKI